mmetsp:Transcript_30/g.116  ORF Transcript_30/g.116 Transcript_30/m.116 type:complete len:264 (+) Transcript_30:585-1376(+)
MAIISRYWRSSSRRRTSSRCMRAKVSCCSCSSLRMYSSRSASILCSSSCHSASRASSSSLARANSASSLRSASCCSNSSCLMRSKRSASILRSSSSTSAVEGTSACRTEAGEATSSTMTCSAAPSSPSGAPSAVAAGGERGRELSGRAEESGLLSSSFSSAPLLAGASLPTAFPARTFALMPSNVLFSSSERATGLLSKLSRPQARTGGARSSFSTSSASCRAPWNASSASSSTAEPQASIHCMSSWKLAGRAGSRSASKVAG